MKGFIKKIEQINFGLMSPEDIRAMSVVTVETPDTYEDDGFPIDKGLMDPRLGVIDPSLVCRTCGVRGGECQGHFGSIELARPVIHIGFGDVIHKILRSTCNECGRVLLTNEQIEEYTKKIVEARENKENIANILKSLQDATKSFEIKDERQEDIVKKIWDEYFPEDVNELEEDQIKDNLIEISKTLFTDAYLEGDDAPRTYLDAKWLCPHCKKNSSASDVAVTFSDVESKLIQSDIDNIFNFNSIISSKNVELSKNIDKIVSRIKKLYKFNFAEDNIPDEELEPFNAFKNEFSDLKTDIKEADDLKKSLPIYNKALSKFNRKALQRLNIIEKEEIENEFIKSIASIENENAFTVEFLKEFIESSKFNKDFEKHVKSAGDSTDLEILKEFMNQIESLEDNAFMSEFKDYIESRQDAHKVTIDLLNEFTPYIESKEDTNIPADLLKGFVKYIEALDDISSIDGDVIEQFENDSARQVQNETRNYIKNYLKKLIQEPIKLDKPVTIRQGDYKLTASEVRERLEQITDEDSFILGVNPEVARPEWLVLTVLPVPPVTVRPSITLDTGERSEDDLTHKLVDILRINQRLLENMDAGAPQLIVEDLWELLQYHVTTYFDNEASGVPPARHRSGRPLKTLTQRLKGKEGRFRSNLSGKRVNFSARTVISPDSNISINEVGVPEMIAKEVTVPVYVNEWNIEEMKKYIKNGPDVHPGANYVIRNDGRKIRVRNEETIELILEQLEPGFIVERHLKDGDMVLFNRQPSLHRMSMMAHEVRVLPYKTFRLNLCVCPPYNADFDGDEMNMHVFQTDESRAEAKSLMRVQEHILSPRFGGPIIGAIHDHISGAYLLTRDGVEFTEEQALQIIRKSHLSLPVFKGGEWVLKTDLDLKPDMEVPEDIEKSFIYKKKGEMWTGKELFSLLLPNDLNKQYTAEISKGKHEITDENDNGISTITGVEGIYPNEDGRVIIENGILKQGVIDEKAYGSFSGEILDTIVKEYGPGRAKEFLDRSTDLAICGIMKTGITTSLNDEEIPQEAQDRINEHLDKKMAEVDKLVEAYEEGYLEALPGRSLQETLEMKIMQVLGEARDMSGSIAENYLTMGKQSDDDSYEHVMAVENHSVVMARTGARASMLNLTQITACVGQQAVRGGRIERGYLNRTLPHFKKGELGAKAKGFVHSSYKSGLDPIEFFFHAMGGREGLVDTAIRTAQSGYMQRRLVNALQDLNVDSKGVVRDNQNNVIQTLYGEDGVDPAKSDFGKVMDFDKTIELIKTK